MRQQGLYWTIAVAVFLAAVAVIFFQNEAFYRDFLGYFSFAPSVVSQPRTARLTIDFGDGTKRAFEGQVAGGMTIISALRVSQAAGQFEAVTDNRGQVIDIAGVKNGNKKRWEVYRNGDAVAELPGHVEIRPGDKLVFRYE